jgi:histone H3/H4
MTATIQKLVKEYMPSELRVAADAVDMLVECCTGERDASGGERARERERRRQRLARSLAPKLPLSSCLLLPHLCSSSSASMHSSTRNHPQRQPRNNNNNNTTQHTTPTEFIQLVSSESNEVATREGKNTIVPEHVLRALDALGFGGRMAGEARAAWDAFKEESKSE